MTEFRPRLSGERPMGVISSREEFVMRVFCSGLFVAALVAALPQIASAQRPGQGQPGQPGQGGRGGFVNPIVAALDTDKDGTISAEELKNAVASLKTLDKDGDG